MDLSLIIRGDSSSLSSAAKGGEAALAGLDKAQASLGSGSRAAAAAQTDLMRRMGETAGEAGRLAQAEAAAAQAAKGLGDAQERVRQSHQNAAGSSTTAVKSADRLNYAYKNLGFQIQDVGAQLATVSGPSGLFRIFAQQGGQIFSALGDISAASAGAAAGFRETGKSSKEAETDLGGLKDGVSEVSEKVAGAGGKLGAFAGFMAGPWGAAILVGVTVLGPLVAKLFEAGEAADEQADKLAKAAQAADSYGAAQSLLGQIIDLTTGKLKTQNAVLIQTIKLQAQANLLKAQADQKTATETLRNAAKPTFGESLRDTIAGNSAVDQGFIGDDAAQFANATRAKLAPLKAVVDEYTKLVNTPGVAQATLDKALDQTLSRIDAIGAAGRDVITTKEQVLDLARTLNDQRANQEVLDAIAGKGVAADLVPYSKPTKGRTRRPRAAPKPKVDSTTPAEIDRIASITSQFDDAPKLIDAAAKATRDLDKIIADLEKRKPPNFQATIQSAIEAKAVVQNGLSKPYRDFIEDQEKGLAVQRLVNEGRHDEADALKIVQTIEESMGPLSVARKNAILATVQAVKAEQREQEIVQQKIQSQLNAINDIKSAVRAVFTDGAKGIADLPKRIISAFTNLRADMIMEKLFGNAFRQLQDRASGVTVVKDASAKMATALEGTLNPLASLAQAAESAASSLGGGGGAEGGSRSSNDPLGIASSIADALAKEQAGKPGTTSTGVEKDIVVKGSLSPEKLFGKQIGTLLGGADGQKGLISKQAAGFIGDKIGQAAGGAATGAMVNSFLKPLGKALGVKTSQTGAQIGGAIGSFIPIPGGDIIGSVIGSIVGGLFKKTPKGSAVITNTTDDAAISGNKAGVRQALTGTASNVQSGIAQIAQQLGGDVGSFNVSIGKRGDSFRVSSTGASNVDAKKTGKISGLIYNGKDEGEAISAAIRDAITDGAVTGLSDAMQRALKANANIDKAVSEALKVQQVEALIGGIGGSITKLFKDFDKEAAERIRVAKAYGLDLLKVEQVNAEQRAKLLDDTLKARVGSLKDFLDSTMFGDLSEGTIADKRNALLAQRATLESDAAAGKDGAADKLADVSQRLLALTRDGFGTAGSEYSGDRATSISGVQRVIEMENARVAEAAAQQQATTTALQQNNDLTNETNYLLSIMNTNIGNLVGAAFGGTLNYAGGGRALTERTTQLV